MEPRNFRLILFIILSLISVELTSSAVLHVLNLRFGIKFQPLDSLSSELEERIYSSMDPSSTKLYAVDSALGWSVQPNIVFGKYATNENGIRSSTKIESAIKENRFRWGTFGDSFTFGDEVNNNQTWQSQIEIIAPQLEILNFGVSGHSIDQAYLNYQQQSEVFDFSGIIIGVQSQDIFEVVNTFRPFFLPSTGIPYTKPRYVIENGRLHLLENPLPNLESYLDLLSNPKQVLDIVGMYDHYYQRRYQNGRFDFLSSVQLFKVLVDEIDRRIADRGIMRAGQYYVGSEAYYIAAAILRSFYQDVQNTRSAPVIIFYPNKKDIINSRLGSDVSYAPLRDQLRQDGLKVIDPQLAFHTDDTVEELIGGHYTALGNLRLAQYLSFVLLEIVDESSK